MKPPGEHITRLNGNIYFNINSWARESYISPKWTELGKWFPIQNSLLHINTKFAIYATILKNTWLN